MTELPRLAVVVVNYGSSALLQANLSGAVEANPQLDVVVVDNFVSESELDSIRRLCSAQGWHLVTSKTNLGFGAGVNAGVEAAQRLDAVQFLLLNPDARIDPESLTRLRNLVTAEPMTLAAPVILTTDGRLWSEGHDLYLDRGRMRAIRKRVGNPRVAPWLSGACLLVSRALWDRLGGFDERYFLYWEDVDLCWRTIAVGGRLQVVPDSTAVHDEGGTQDRTSDRALSRVYYYFNVRNRLLFAAQHLPASDQVRWAATAVPEAYAILLRGGRKQLVRSLVPWWAALTGTCAGLWVLARGGKGSSRPRYPTGG